MKDGMTTLSIYLMGHFQIFKVSPLHLRRVFSLWDPGLSKSIGNSALKSLEKTLKMNALSCSSLRKAMTKKVTKINKNSLAVS